MADGVQYHCVPMRGCIRVKDQSYRALLPDPVETVTFTVRTLGPWEDNRPADFWRSVLWLFRLIPREADVANCVTCTCWLIGIDIPARTPQGLMNFLRRG